LDGQRERLDRHAAEAKPPLVVDAGAPAGFAARGGEVDPSAVHGLAVELEPAREGRGFGSRRLGRGLVRTHGAATRGRRLHREDHVLLRSTLLFARERDEGIRRAGSAARDPEQPEQERAAQDETCQEPAVPRGSGSTHAVGTDSRRRPRSTVLEKTRTRHGGSRAIRAARHRPAGALRVIRTLGRSIWGTNAEPLASAVHGVARQGERLLGATVEKSRLTNKIP